MDNSTIIELRAFVPSRDFEVSKQFYQELGFAVAWSTDDLACMTHGKRALWVSMGV